jgi:carboxylesterase type B
VAINNGDNNYNGKPLFHGAIMNSGVVLATQSAVSDKAQAVFDTVAKHAGCPLGSDVLDCLRQVSYKTFKKAMNQLPNFGDASSNNLAYIHRPDPASDFYSQFGADAAKTGRYARVPMIMGNMQDEATIFTPAQKGVVNDTDSLVDYFATWFTQAPRKVIEGLVATYNATPSEGLPTGTGSLYEIYPQSKRNAAMQTDLTFGMGRRIVLADIASQIPAWSYLATYLQGNPWWGSYHTADLGTQFSLAVNTFAGTKMDEAYVHFVNYHNPNGKSGRKKWWPQYDSQNRQMANFSKSEVGITIDDYRWESFKYWSKYQSNLRQ